MWLTNLTLGAMLRCYIFTKAEAYISCAFDSADVLCSSNSWRVHGLDKVRAELVDWLTSASALAVPHSMRDTSYPQDFLPFRPVYRTKDMVRGWGKPEKGLACSSPT